MADRRRSQWERRRIGALAGIAPAAVILAYYFATGGPIQPGLSMLVAAAVVAGWLVGPAASGTVRADSVALVAYTLAGYLVNLALGIVASILDGLDEGLLTVIGTPIRHAIPAAVYLPVWMVFLAPVGLVWVLTVRVLRSWHGAPGA